MDSTRGPRPDAALAIIITALVHVALAWGLSRAMRPLPAPIVDKPLQIVWVSRHKAPPGVVEPTGNVEPVRHPAQIRRAPAEIGTSAVAAEEDPRPTPESARPMTAVYLMQVRDPMGKAAVQAADPLADRVAELPGAGAGRFRMKPPPTGVAGVVASVGKLFGAEDAGAPCRENRRNIGELAASGDSAALQQQLEFERRLCRP